LATLEAEARHQRFGVLRRRGRRHARDRRPALCDRPVEQALCGRHAEQRAHFACAAGLTEDRDVLRIAAEAVDVVADPREARDDVLLSGVAGFCEAFTAELRQVDESEHIQPMGDADHHHVVPPRQVRAVVRERSGRSARVAASVQPHHDGTPDLGRRAGRPDVQVQAVFAHRLGAGQQKMPSLRAMSCARIAVGPCSRTLAQTPDIDLRGPISEVSSQRSNL